MPELTTGLWALFAVALAGYLLGSIPFGVIMAKLFGLGDLRAIGSGNIGATNVLRTGNKVAAFLTLVLDAAKGGVAVLIACAYLGEDAAQLAGLTSFLGHLFPVWLGFKGGKGVATFLGILLALNWPLGLTACAIWLVAAFGFRISSMGAIASSLTAPIAAYFYQYIDAMILVSLLALLVLVRHAANIRRILGGTEPRIGQKK
jgi:acyl phosphate:glycerol-3-phosphate acyltransferase